MPQADLMLEGPGLRLDHGRVGIVLSTSDELSANPEIFEKSEPWSDLELPNELRLLSILRTLGPYSGWRWGAL